MQRKFLLRAFLAVALSTAPAFAGGPAPVGVLAQKSDMPLLIRPFSTQTAIALKPQDPSQSPKKVHSDRKTLYWVIGITAAAALAIGLTAAAQGKSPF